VSPSLEREREIAEESRSFLLGRSGDGSTGLLGLGKTFIFYMGAWTVSGFTLSTTTLINFLHHHVNAV
jgi:hypothetical protein